MLIAECRQPRAGYKSWAREVHISAQAFLHVCSVVPVVHAKYCSWYRGIGPWEKIQESMLCESGSVFAQGISGSGQDVVKTSKCPRCACRLTSALGIPAWARGRESKRARYVSLGVSLKTILTLLKLFFRLPPVRQCLFGSRCSRSSFSRALVSICDFFSMTNCIGV